MDRGAWWATVHGSQRGGHDQATHTHTHTHTHASLVISLDEIFYISLCEI